MKMDYYNNWAGRQHALYSEWRWYSYGWWGGYWYWYTPSDEEVKNHIKNNMNWFTWLW